jgi:hypothetical protein
MRVTYYANVSICSYRGGSGISAVSKAVLLIYHPWDISNTMALRDNRYTLYRVIITLPRAEAQRVRSVLKTLSLNGMCRWKRHAADCCLAIPGCVIVGLESNTDPWYDRDDSNLWFLHYALRMLSEP